MLVAVPAASNRSGGSGGSGRSGSSVAVLAVVGTVSSSNSIGKEKSTSKRNSHYYHSIQCFSEFLVWALCSYSHS